MIRILIAFGFLLSLRASAMPPALQRTVAEVAAAAARGIAPVVIADLDETLVDSTPRRFAAFRESVSRICGTDRAAECGTAAGLNIAEFYALENHYDQSPLMTYTGISPALAFNLLSETLKIYSSGDFLERDQAVPGATELVQALRNSGAEIFFVSSRTEDVQRSGTLESLRFLGLLSGDEGNVILKPRGMSSIEFKRSSFAKIKIWVEQKNARVMLVMENEPENMNAMTDAFPQAAAVFVNGAFVKREPLRGPVLRLNNFR